MDIGKFLKENFGSKEIEIKLPPANQREVEPKDEYATRRRLFESKMLKVFSLALGMNILAMSERQPGATEIVVEKEALSDTQVLYQKLGPEFENFLRQMKEYEVKKETIGEEPIEVGVGNFEEVETTNEEIKNLLLKTYPKNWLERVKGLVLVPYQLEAPTEYNVKGRAIAIADKRGEPGGAEIVFSQNLSNVFSAMSHELGHANDWLNRTDLPQAYRIKLLRLVVERLDKGDRYRSPYVESIINKNPQKQLMHRATEYWGEIIQFYFDQPKEAKTRLSPYDLDLIEKFLRDVAPDFNPETAALERQVRQKLVAQSVIEKRFRKQAAKMKIAHLEIFLDQIKQYSREFTAAATAVAHEPTEAADLDLDFVLSQVFDEGDKKWIEVDNLYLEGIGLLRSLADLHRKGGLQAEAFSLLESRIGELRDLQNKFSQKMKTFSKEEQKKIREFHARLENVVRQEQINPRDIDVQSYYE